MLLFPRSPKITTHYRPIKSFSCCRWIGGSPPRSPARTHSCHLLGWPCGLRQMLFLRCQNWKLRMLMKHFVPNLCTPWAVQHFLFNFWAVWTPAHQENLRLESWLRTVRVELVFIVIQAVPAVLGLSILLMKISQEVRIVVASVTNLGKTFKVNDDRRGNSWQIGTDYQIVQLGFIGLS